MEIYKTYNHNPPHLFRAGAKYFITASTYQQKHYMATDEAKDRLIHSILKGFQDYGWKLDEWVLLNNHYHLMADAPEDPRSLSKIIQEIHKFTAMWIKKNSSGFSDQKKIWYNYWDTCITHEKSYFARLNYIWYNPVKHGYVKDAAAWRFGSYYSRVRAEKDYLEELKSKYPFDRLNVRDDF